MIKFYLLATNDVKHATGITSHDKIETEEFCLKKAAENLSAALCFATDFIFEILKNKINICVHYFAWAYIWYRWKHRIYEMILDIMQSLRENLINVLNLHPKCFSE